MRQAVCSISVICSLSFIQACGSSADDSSGDPASAGATAQTGGAAQTTGGASTSGGGTGDGGAGATTGGSGSGGAATGGGSTGSGGSPPQTVLPCDGLPAAGVWEEITPPEHQIEGYRSASFVVDPNNAGIAYLGTDSFNDGNSKGVLKTTDCGATWSQVSTGDNSEQINGGRQWTFEINPIDSQVLYTNSGYYHLGLFKSTNGGVDWIDVTPQGDGAPGFVGNLQMDREDPDHLLVTWHAPCNGPNNEYSWEDQVGCFHETTDGGATWKGHYGSPKWPSEVRVLLLHGSTWVVLSDNVLYTTDAGASFTSVLSGGLGGHSSGSLSCMGNGDCYIGTQDGIYRSPAASDGADWTKVGSAAWVGEIAESKAALFATQQQNVFLTSPVSDGVEWSLMMDSARGCERAKYDAGHSLLYASCGAAGFWRVVVE